jgi:CRP-like cAMP-binding protein
VPRTATVTAVEPSRLLVVRSEDFLAAVTGSEDGQALARDVAATHVSRDRG